ncbi:DNA-directed RNA polymerase I subunit RPA34 isoform X2 [Rhinoderma darwinii]|uniref:DNA-directed RNA polymerase I subunit RPA34 isoform X2 n=1 Tax=Rhinoderma darwinii TaxID=43563 RepID=UPI003F6613E0
MPCVGSGGGRCSFQCPPGFVAVAGCDGSVASDLDTELWLIKAPPDFTPQSFDSHRFPLSGYKMQKIRDDGVRKFYHVVSSPGAAPPLRAFLHPSGVPEETLVAAAPLQGVITLAEAHGDHTAQHSVPDRPPLTLPPGLKLRYRPFGAAAPAVVNREDSQLSESSKKRRKAKKRRRGALERDDV